ncbi:hypothetical protein NEOLEDRAFT_1128500 [Neolentinus lepideus HHB14362 ss-1]|uniref:F-box domain-containing protein n=1 Tax=Neolentinus lepideus HHB14362 ss-1 TaxID=1314782 RepID=A0A165V171_9AGAM|nr:hypothetical protein NEOLEDRAFT_1128500 [Neolentinus lepideus HHB14362 ss-1]
MTGISLSPSISLPSELLHAVIDYSELRDAWSCRPVSRQFYNIATGRVFYSVCLDFSGDKTSRTEHFLRMLCDTRAPCEAIRHLTIRKLPSFIAEGLEKDLCDLITNATLIMSINLAIVMGLEGDTPVHYPRLVDCLHQLGAAGSLVNLSAYSIDHFPTEVKLPGGRHFHALRLTKPVEDSDFLRSGVLGSMGLKHLQVHVRLSSSTDALSFVQKVSTVLQDIEVLGLYFELKTREFCDGTSHENFEDFKKFIMDICKIIRCCERLRVLGVATNFLTIAAATKDEDLINLIEEIHAMYLPSTGRLEIDWYGRQWDVTGGYAPISNDSLLRVMWYYEYSVTSAGATDFDDFVHPRT